MGEKIDLSKMNMTEQQMVDLAMQTNLNKYDNLNLLMEILKSCKEDVHPKAAKRGYTIATNAATSLLTGKAITNNEIKQAQDYYELARRFCTYGGRADFDLYMIACEWNREPNARFWLPRRRVLEGKHHIATKIQNFIDDPKKLMFTLSTPPGAGKALANDTPVLTRNGWKKHGDLVVGDEVIGENGDFKKVLNVFPKIMLDCKVTFGNGQEIVCHENHEWKAWNRNQNIRKWDLYETKEIEKEPLYFYVSKPPIVKGEAKKLSVKPYTLGAWLGDGENRNPRICNAIVDNAIIHRIIQDGYALNNTYIFKKKEYGFYSFKGLRKDLHKIRLCYNEKRVEKYIPNEYYTASIEQRLDLLAGLIDTDGNYVQKKNRYCFTTSSDTLRNDFIKLISTFGWRATLYQTTTKARKINNRFCKESHSWAIWFNASLQIPCALKRKQNRPQTLRYSRYPIKKIERIKEIEGNCIEVEGGMYLVGETLIPTHNSTLIKFLLSFIAGRYPLSANIYVSYSDGMVKMMYDSIGGILTDTDEYKHNDIFPYNGNIIMSAEYNTISYRRKGDFPTIGCVSLGGSVTGRTRANKFMVTDDLVRNAEMARSPERLQKLWDDYRDTITTRQIGDNVKQIMLGTIWSLHDPISRTKTEHEDDPRYTFIAIPIEDEYGHSNFLYDCADRYTDEKIRDIKETLDTVTYSCLYLQKPMEREGLLFHKEDLNYYNGVLPDGTPDRIIFACDVAYGGGDSLSMPIAYIYDGRVYIHDVVFNKGDKKITQPIVIGKIEKHKPHAGRFEANNGGDAYAEDVSQGIKTRVNITWKKAPTTQSKVSRIIQYAPDISSFYFLDKAHRSEEYQKFFDEFVSFVQTGKNLHDDAPDSLAQLAAFIFDTISTKVSFINRPF